MIIDNQARNLVQNLRALHVRHAIDAEAIDTCRKETLPARKRMRPYNRVVRLKVQAGVVSGAAGATVHSVRVFFRGLREGGGFVRGG